MCLLNLVKRVELHTIATITLFYNYVFTFTEIFLHDFELLSNVLPLQPLFAFNDNHYHWQCFWGYKLLKPFAKYFQSQEIHGLWWSYSTFGNPTKIIQPVDNLLAQKCSLVIYNNKTLGKPKRLIMEQLLNFSISTQ